MTNTAPSSFQVQCETVTRDLIEARILALHDRRMPVREISERLRTHPSFIDNVIAAATIPRIRLSLNGATNG